MSDEPENEVREATGDMESAAREMEHHGDEVDADIAESQQRLDDLRDRQGDAAGDVAGDWHETEDEAGGEDPSGAGRSVEVERDDEAGRGSERRG